MKTALLLALVALAGCAESAPTDPDDGLGLAPTETTGIIRGVVVDDAIVPVEGATVTLIASGEQVATNQDGLFGFQGLEAGQHFLGVTAPGFSDVQASATVVAGQANPPVQKISLPRIPEDARPFVIATQYTAYVNCAALAANSLQRCDPENVAFGEDDSEPFFSAPATVPNFLQVETAWQPNQQGGDRITLTVYACDLQGACNSGPDGGQRMCQVWGGSPQTCSISQAEGHGNPDGTGGGAGLKSVAFGTGDEPGFKVWIAADCAEVACVPGTALGAGALIQQDIEIFNHLFYNFEPTPDWTFLEDGAPVAPDGPSN